MMRSTFFTIIYSGYLLAALWFSLIGLNMLSGETGTITLKVIALAGVCICFHAALIMGFSPSIEYKKLKEAELRDPWENQARQLNKVQYRRLEVINRAMS